MTLTSKYRAIATFSLLASLLMASFQVSAKCQLPIPDGGDESYIPSKENIFGDIEKVEFPYVFIRDGRTHQVEKVSISKIEEVYSSYGGDAPLTALQPKLQVWVWFKNCSRLKTGVPEVAYFQFFSTNPNDRATLDGSGKIISAP